eukprot:9478821-Pyramimonas_sp.AAC.1
MGYDPNNYTGEGDSEGDDESLQLEDHEAALYEAYMAVELDYESSPEQQQRADIKEETKKDEQPGRECRPAVGTDYNLMFDAAL